MKKNKGLNISTGFFLIAIAIIFVLMICTYVLTLIIPGGEYERIVDASGNDVSANYEIKREWGKVTITNRSITVTTDGYNAVYDGKNHIFDTLYDTTDGIEDKGLCEDHDFRLAEEPFHSFFRGILFCI